MSSVIKKMWSAGHRKRDATRIMASQDDDSPDTIWIVQSEFSCHRSLLPQKQNKAMKYFPRLFFMSDVQHGFRLHHQRKMTQK
jgi:hypothetical protein